MAVCANVRSGVRGLEIKGQFVTFTAIGVYLEDKAVTWLAGKWKGKTAGELTESVQFFNDIVTGKMTLLYEFLHFLLPNNSYRHSKKHGMGIIVN